MSFSQDDFRHMQRALALAARGQGWVEPNPMVGCVIVRKGRVVGEGFHERYGGPHAEPNALRRAGARARGATVYVTLEPCCHFGKTPPCVDALLAAGVGRVVAAMRDPNPLVAGKGLRLLRKAGLQTDTGLMGNEAAALNAPFVTYFVKRRPWVILKWAQSLDGKIATRTGDSRWITGEASRADAHALRARVDGVLVGIGTVFADDPDLTARMAAPRRVATRIVLDSRLRIPLNSRLVRTASRVPVLLICSPDAAKQPKARRLEKAGCHVLAVRRTRQGIHLPSLLAKLRGMQMTNLMVEGGGHVLGAFVDQRLADEAVVYVAPRLIGGEGAPGPLRGKGPASMAESPGVKLTSLAFLGDDWCHRLSL